MCELFGMSSRLPTTVNRSIAEFARHGGLSGPHSDGWGIAFFDGTDVRLFKEPEPAAESSWIPFVQERSIESSVVISHLRRATRGPRALRNTQPFCREMGGRKHVFAHNGFFVGVDDLDLGTFRPVGDTDSEVAFCHLLARLQLLQHYSDRTPGPMDVLAVVESVAERLAAMGPANFLYSDGQTMYAHSDRRRGADGTIAPPGLHILTRECALEGDGEKQSVVLIASQPLSDERWRPVPEGTILVVSEGLVLGSAMRRSRGAARARPTDSSVTAGESSQTVH
ncbi:MAG: class II glutamine amidotransferase [Rhodospirillales bacterium]|jgi:glutamine amidotransferase|nr:class II glutamine amidotransferase [Rhodospirillales bacterium]